MTLTHVHTPFRIRGMELKNRVVRPAHGTRLGGGRMSEDLIAYHAVRAAGGVGLTVLEIMGVHQSSPSSLPGYDDALEGGYRDLVETVRPYRMRLLQQLWHGGHNASPADGSPPWSASNVPGPLLNATPIPMTQAMIDEVVQAYAAAAKRCERWGVDGVELHFAHGYLPAQFLSPNANTREDGYGGSFENRARFSLEVAQAVRAAVSAAFVVGVRVAPDATVGGVGPDENLRLAQELEAKGLVDYVSVSMGNYHSFSKMIGGMHEPTGYELPTSAPVVAGVKSPTMVVGRFRTLEEADQAIRNGDADLVGMVRATIADPQLVKKSLEGRAEQVRPCIGCNQGCVGQILQPPFRMSCTVNPSTGYERQFGDHKLEPAAEPRSVLVIGGGPAGMEAARVAATRGHSVVLAEAEPTLGGAVKLAAMAPFRAGIKDVTLWLEQEIYRLGVDVRLSTYLDVEDVPALGPDVVIVATGATPRMDGVQISNPGESIRGFEQPQVISSHDLFLAEHRELGRTAVVIDDLGHYEAVAAAEHLVDRGLEVTFVTRHISFAPLVESALMTEPALQRLSKGRFAVRQRARAISIGPQTVTIGPVFLPATSNQLETVPADTVVFVSHNRPNREIYDGLKGGPCRMMIVGDANSPRHLPTAMREGHLAGVAA